MLPADNKINKNKNHMQKSKNKKSSEITTDKILLVRENLGSDRSKSTLGKICWWRKQFLIG